MDLPAGYQNGINLAEHINLFFRNDGASGVELPLYHTDQNMENTVSNLHIEQHGTSDVPLISSKGKIEHQESNGICRTTGPCPSRILLADAKAREQEVVRKRIDRLEKQVLQFI